MDSAGVGEWFRQLFHVSDALTPERRGVCPVATFTDPATSRVTSVTCGFSAHDVGLRAAPPLEASPHVTTADVRVELMCQATPGCGELVPSAVAAATVALLTTPDYVPQPGTVMPDLAETVRGWRGHTCHGLLAAPSLWANGVPHLWEEDAEGSTGMLTVPLQLVMLTPDEYAHGVTYSFAVLLEDMAAEGRCLEDWDRPA